jgi:hypothetical protein
LLSYICMLDVNVHITVAHDLFFFELKLPMIQGRRIHMDWEICGPLYSRDLTYLFYFIVKVVTLDFRVGPLVARENLMWSVIHNALHCTKFGQSYSVHAVISTSNHVPLIWLKTVDFCKISIFNSAKMEDDQLKMII